MLESLDAAVLQFSPGSLQALNVAQALMMFIVSLYLDGAALRGARQLPKAVAVGLLSQWLLLPALTVLLILLLDLPAGAALGLLLVAACPGGNAAGFLALFARGNVTLSVAITAVSTLGLALLTPLVFALSARAANVAGEGQGIQVGFMAVFEMALTLLVLPLLAGMLFRRYLPQLALRVRGPLKLLLAIVLTVFVLGALQVNGRSFQGFILAVAPLVFLHNLLALAGGYLLAWFAGLVEADRRSIAIASGITNSGLCLVLVFSFFKGAGAMAVIALWWGGWRLVTAGLLAWIWSRRPPASAPPLPPQPVAAGAASLA